MFESGDTHVSVEFREGVDHIKSVHVHYGGVDDELGSGGDNGQGEKQFGRKNDTRRRFGVPPCFLPDVASTELAPPGRLASRACDCLPDTERWRDSPEAVFDSGVGRPFSHRSPPPGLPARKAPRLSLPYHRAVRCEANKRHVRDETMAGLSTRAPRLRTLGLKRSSGFHLATIGLLTSTNLM